MPSSRFCTQKLPRTARACPSCGQPSPTPPCRHRKEPFGLALALFGLLASVLCFPVGALTGLIVLLDSNSYWLVTKIMASLGLLYAGAAVLVIAYGIVSL